MRCLSLVCVMTVTHIVHLLLNHSSPLNGSRQGLSKGLRSVRKLPWSDGGEDSVSEVHPVENSKFTVNKTFVNVSEGTNPQPSVDTPNRAEMLQNFRWKQRFGNVLGKGSFGTVIEATYKGLPFSIKFLLTSMSPFLS